MKSGRFKKRTTQVLRIAGVILLIAYIALCSKICASGITGTTDHRPRTTEPMTTDQ